MMYDWHDPDQIGDTLWGAFGEIEDHIVPHPKKGDTLSTVGDYKKNKRNEEISSAVRSTEQTSRDKNDFPGCNLENSRSNTNEEFSASTLEMDTWPDLPNLGASPNNEYNDESVLDFFAKEMMNDLSDSPNLNSVRAGGTVQLDGAPELISNEQAGKGSDIFLDFDWANIDDDDLNRYFRNNDNISIHDMIDNADEFLSTSAEVISSTAQSIPMPDIPLCNNPPSDHGCSSSQLEEDSDGIKNPLQKEKVDGKNRLLRSQIKAEPRSKKKPLQKVTVVGNHNENHKQYISSHKSHTYDANAPDIFQSDPGCHLGSSNQVVYTEYGYPTYSVPSFPHGHAERSQKRHVPVGDKFYPDPLRYSKSSEKLLDVPSKPVTMTPQEKIDKLRRRQQLQAMLAIQKQQQHYGHQIIGTDDSFSQACSQESQSQDAATSIIGIEECANKLPSSEKSLLEKNDEQKSLSMLIDDKSLEEIIYYQLQDSLKKLDVRMMICIRDSLFRLARSAIDRQIISDSSTNGSNKDVDKVIVDEDTNHQDRHKRLLDSETVTNHIDRIVAHLLFHRPLESSPRSLNIPQSPNM